MALALLAPPARSPFLLLCLLAGITRSVALRGDSLHAVQEGLGTLEEESRSDISAGSAANSSANSSWSLLPSRWKVRIPSEECTSLGHPHVPYDLPFPDDPKLTAVWRSIAVADDQGGARCDEPKPMNELKAALERYLQKHLGFDLGSRRQRKVVLRTRADTVFRGLAWVENRACMQRTALELEEYRRGDRARPREGACGRDEPLEVVLNVFGNDCLLFRTLPDVRHLVAMLVHEMYHVYQSIDCWDTLSAPEYLGGFREFQASRDEWKRYQALSPFIRAVAADESRSYTDPKFGLTWRLFATKFADYYSKIDEGLLARRPDLEEEFYHIIVDLCQRGVPIDRGVWSVSDLTRAYPSKETCLPS